jgi:hypothetical protein
MATSLIHILKQDNKLRVEQESWTVMYCVDADEVEACISDPSVIWPLIYRALGVMADEDRESMIVLEIRCDGIIGSVWVTMRTSDVMETLSKMLAWRESREEYEECADIVKLKKRWEEIILSRGDDWYAKDYDA